MGGTGTWIILLVALGGMFIWTWFSSRKKDKKEAEMRNGITVGDEITTIGGIIGKVVSVKDETMVIETTRDHTRIRLLKSAVRSVDVPASAKRVSAEKVAETAEKKAEPDKKLAPAELKEDKPVKKTKKTKKEEATAEVVEEAPATEEVPATEENNA